MKSKQDDSNDQIPLIGNTENPAQLLDELIHSERENKNTTSINNNTTINSKDNIFDIDDIAFPETARWALCGIKNLTRQPNKDSYAGHKLLECNVLPALLKTINVDHNHDHHDPQVSKIDTK